MSSPYLQYLPDHVQLSKLAEHIDAVSTRLVGPLDAGHFMTLRFISMVAAPHWKVLEASPGGATMYAPLSEGTCAIAVVSGARCASDMTAVPPLHFYREFASVDAMGWPTSKPGPWPLEKISEQEFMKYIAANLDTLRVAAVKEAL
jgi:hypothetical protein